MNHRISWGRYGLADPALLNCGVAASIGREELEGDGTVELEILSLVDDPPPPATETFKDRVAG
jgi:hypothetical protein